MQNLIIPNKENFNLIKKKIQEQGKNKLHVLADFDRTLTKAFYRGEKAGSLISQLRVEKGKYLTRDYAEKAQKLFNRYHPIEIDSSIPLEEKNKKMYEWWKEHKILLIEKGLDKKTIQRAVNDMIKEDTLSFREGVEDFLKYLERNQILLVIMSSSLEDLITEFMKQKGVLTKNVHIIGNAFKFNRNGKATGIERIIHVFNKNEMSLESLQIYNQLLKRKNVILLGDSLGDLGMIEGFPYNNLLKIGFLNENVKDNLEEYKKNYDILILNDGDFGEVNKLIRGLI